MTTSILARVCARGWLLVPSLIAATVGCVDPVEDGPELGESEDELYKTDYFGWPRDASGVTTTVPICWNENTYHHGPPEPARTSYKAFVRRAIEETWQRETALIFTGWGECNAGNGGTYGILLEFADRANGYANPVHPPWEPLHADIQLPGGEGETSYLRYTAIHEVGHALGIVHEQARSDNHGRCEDFGTNDGVPSTWPGQFMTPWDDRSVMNYCAANPTELSPLDILGIQRLYGRKPGPRLVSSRGLCVGTSGTSVIPTRCSGGGLDLAPAGDWLRLAYSTGGPTGPSTNGYARLPSTIGALGPLTMSASPGNWNWDRYKLKDVTLRGLGGRKLRASEGTTLGGDVITWDNGSINWANGSVAAERWSFMPDGSIRNSNGLCLDVSGANPASGTRVQMYTCNGTSAQKWALGDGDTIRSLVSSSVTRCLEVNRSETDTTSPFPVEQPVRIASCTGTLRQQWSARGAVTTLDNAGCLSIPASGGAVSQVSCSSAPEQVIDVHW